MPEARGGSREELPHAPKPETRGGGREEQAHARGQGWWPGGPTPHPRSRGCLGAGGLEELSRVEGQEGRR